LLLDTGFNTALMHDAALRRRFHGDPIHRAILPGPGEPLEEALSHAGIEMAGCVTSQVYRCTASGASSSTA
jgi:N-acyl homoserine lactone hydrolase